MSSLFLDYAESTASWYWRQIIDTERISSGTDFTFEDYTWCYWKFMALKLKLLAKVLNFSQSWCLLLPYWKADWTSLHRWEVHDKGLLDVSACHIHHIQYFGYSFSMLSVGLIRFFWSWTTCYTHTHIHTRTHTQQQQQQQSKSLWSLLAHHLCWIPIHTHTYWNGMQKIYITLANSCVAIQDTIQHVDRSELRVWNCMSKHWIFSWENWFHSWAYWIPMQSTQQQTRVLYFYTHFANHPLIYMMSTRYKIDRNRKLEYWQC